MTRVHKPLSTILAILICLAHLATAADLRQNLSFNRGWKFQLGDAIGAEQPGFDDTAWDHTNLPHSFSIPYFGTEKFYVGYGWYRNTIDVPQAWSGKRISMEFDGAFQVTEVFINGKRIGEHKGGYTGFAFDITDALKPGSNSVAVRVNNFWNPRIAPRAGEHVFSGGIYRNVRLVVTSPLRVAWYGTFVTTPRVSAEAGTVNVKTEVINHSNNEKTATLHTAIVDPDGKTVAEIQSTQSIAAGATRVFDQTSQPIAKPRLWSPEEPNLYTVKTTVIDDGKPVDDFTSPLGFRWFEFTADKGFFLNGKHHYLKGANVHQDHAGWGDAAADSAFFRDVRMMKEAGFDFIRGSHYPHAPAFSRACDELGVLFWSENCLWGTGGFQGDGYWNASAYPVNPADEAEFEASVKASLEAMIRIHRNHPSIIVWSMSNEPFFSDETVMPKLRKLLADVVALSRQLDPTRPAAIGGCQRGGIDKLGDLAGYNGDGASLPDYQNPGVPSIVSEYGSTVVDRPGEYQAGWGELARTPGADPNKIGSWRMPWRSGEAIWCGFDHGSQFGRSTGGMGIVDFFRLPKRSWYWYRNEYRNIPPPDWPGDSAPAALKLTADKTTLNSADGTDDVHLIVTVMGQDGRETRQCPPVTLTIESGPGEFPTGPRITFTHDSDIAVRDGKAAIAFHSHYAGRTLIRATSPGLKDATVELLCKGGPEFVPGKTPPVPDRPYRNLSGTMLSETSVTLGVENPTRASSEAPGHSGRLANDGNPATFWQAAANDTHANLRVDLERICVVSSSKITFPSPGNWRYRIEISSDGNSNWKLIADQSQSIDQSAQRRDTSASPDARGRYLRITILQSPNNQPGALAELEVQAKLSGSP
jgi:hypothetical protein